MNKEKKKWLEMNEEELKKETEFWKNLNLFFLIIGLIALIFGVGAFTFDLAYYSIIFVLIAILNVVMFGYSSNINNHIDQLIAIGRIKK